MTQQTIKQIEGLYTDNLKEHGISSESVGWPNKQDHALRFEKLFQGVDLTTVRSLNDLGCGYGAVLDYLSLSGKYLENYFAYDISQDMLDSIDIQRYKQTNIKKFLGSGLSAPADFSIASGIFNVRFSETEELWLNYTKKMLCNLNENSLQGFSFNLLSTYVDFKRDHLFYGDPLFFFDYCKKNFSRYVSLHHDYPLYEWTVVVKK
jgi:SAM-dependent methyltransferase